MYQLLFVRDAPLLDVDKRTVTLKPTSDSLQANDWLQGRPSIGDNREGEMVSCLMLSSSDRRIIGVAVRSRGGARPEDSSPVLLVCDISVAHH